MTKNLYLQKITLNLKKIDLQVILYDEIYKTE